MSATATTSDLSDLTNVLALTMLDRCDHCNAQAYQRWVDANPEREYEDTGDLLFCGHHGNKYSKTLKSKGFELVVNDIEKINAKSESSA